MDSEDIGKINNLYGTRFQDASLPDHKKVGWGSRESQDLRFQILAEIGFQKGDSLIDIGCGLGGFLDFLRAQGLHPSAYHGVDLCSDFLKDCRKRYPESDGCFFTEGLLKDAPPKIEADFVFSSGAFNLKMKDNYSVVVEHLEEAWKRCKKGVAFNFLSSYVDFSHEKDFHYVPEELFRIGRGITKFVTLRHDYPLYEFTLYLHRRTP